jgi:hypothetical protein
MYTNQHKDKVDKAVAPECIVLDHDMNDTSMNSISSESTDLYSSLVKECTQTHTLFSSTSATGLVSETNNTTFDEFVHNSNSGSESSGKISPYKASIVRKSMLRDNKKQIHGKTKKLKNCSSTSQSNDDTDHMMICRQKRLELEEKRDLRMGMIEEKKINLEVQKMMMDKTSNELKFETIRLHNMQKRKKLLLINMEVYEKCLKMRRENLGLSEDMLDEMFPMDK